MTTFTEAPVTPIERLPRAQEDYDMLQSSEPDSASIITIKEIPPTSREPSSEPRAQITNLPPTLISLPPEIHLRIFQELNPIDFTCLVLSCKHLYTTSLTRLTRLNPLVPGECSLPPLPCLLSGSPQSQNPVIQASGCRHCTPALYYPAHCELHFHLKCFMPSDMKYCAGRCQRYTVPAVEEDGRICRGCSGRYSRRFERGRRHLDMTRPGGPQPRLRKWFNWGDNKFETVSGGTGEEEPTGAMGGGD
ncbi:hypothetical protein BGZ60DRAFT_522188 [Tricladium varicosporioides]|nr:hypothetical protein BGZ60DRAFT_522188 [Hymenoscyphus varicosporioides]